MRVYELMNKLAEMPAGAEVNITGTFTKAEIKDLSEIGDDLFGFRLDITDVDGDKTGVDIQV